MKPSPFFCFVSAFAAFEPRIWSALQRIPCIWVTRVYPSLVSRVHCLSYVLSISEKVVYSLSVGCTEVFRIWSAFIRQYVCRPCTAVWYILPAVKTNKNTQSTGSQAYQESASARNLAGKCWDQSLKWGHSCKRLCVSRWFRRTFRTGGSLRREAGVAPRHQSVPCFPLIEAWTCPNRKC